MQTLIVNRATVWVALLLVTFTLVACGKSSPAQVSASAAIPPSNSQNASLALQPASGYGGIYVQVSGENWPQNMIVLVTLEDAQGRSETLAASDTDKVGNLTTGFLFPIDQRWLSSESPQIVTTTADGSVEAKAPFTLVPPGTEAVAKTPDEQSTKPSDAITDTGTVSDTVTDIVTDTVALAEKELTHTLILPLVASAGPERNGNGRSYRETADSSPITKVDVDIDPSGSKRIDCRKGDQWIRVAIYSDSDFDATSVDPGSVVVSGGSSDLGYGGSSTVLISLNARNHSAYQWKWHLDDVNSDGTSDMVLEFQINYTELTCNATVVAVKGRTSDGKRFEGSNRVDMLVVERG